MKKRTVLMAAAAAALTAGMTMTSLAGWKQEGNRWYYYKDSNGQKITNDWVKDGNLYYYMDGDGVMVAEALIDNTYYVNSRGAMVTNEWRQVQDAWSGEQVWKYFGSNGKAYGDGIKEIGGVKYAFSDGAMLTGWVEDGDNIYYFKDSGAMVSGWKYLVDREEDDWNEYWYYFQPSGKLLTGADKKIDNVNYVFDRSGRMLTGWVDTSDYTSTSLDNLTNNDINALKYFTESGSAANGWKCMETPWDHEENWYYFKDGRAYSYDYKTTKVGNYGMAKIDEKYYCFDEAGRMVTGLVEAESDTYFCFNEQNGTMLTGRVIVESDEFDNQEFFFAKTGSVGTRGKGVTGVEDGRLYENGLLVCAEDGMLYQVKDVNGKEYLVNEQGKVKTSGTVKDADGVKYKVTKASNGTYTITIVE